MNTRMRVAFACYLVSTIIIAGIGTIYLFSRQLLPFQLEALGTTWGEIPPRFQVLFLALKKLASGGLLATALGLGVLLFVPFRKGEAWARWAISAIGLSFATPLLYGMLLVKFETPASPPWLVGVLMIVLFVVGFLLASTSRESTRHGPPETVAA